MAWGTSKKKALDNYAAVIKAERQKLIRQKKNTKAPKKKKHKKPQESSSSSEASDSSSESEADMGLIEVPGVAPVAHEKNPS